MKPLVKPLYMQVIIVDKFPGMWEWAFGTNDPGRYDRLVLIAFWNSRHTDDPIDADECLAGIYKKVSVRWMKEWVEHEFTRVKEGGEMPEDPPKYFCAACGATSNLIRPQVDDPTKTFCKDCKARAESVDCNWEEGDVVQIRPSEPYGCSLAIVLKSEGHYAQCYIPSPGTPIDVVLSPSSACYVGKSHWDAWPRNPKLDREAAKQLYHQLLEMKSCFAESLGKLIEQWEQEDSGDPKPWEYLKNALILWVGNKHDFLPWLQQHVPGTIAESENFDCRLDLKSGNVFRCVHKLTLNLRGLKPQMILIDKDGELLQEQHLELKALGVFAQTVFLEDYE